MHAKLCMPSVSPITAAVRLPALRTAERLFTWGDEQASETAAIPAALLA